MEAIVQMRLGTVIDLDPPLALSAAKIGHELKLALADSIILATARSRAASLWTQDADFKNIEGVRYQAKK